MSVQLENGYIRIANEIWDEIIRRDFTKRQKDILLFIWRLSYGCSKKTAIIPKLKYFSICGVGATNITSELKYLQMMKVISWDRETMVFSFNKDYGVWQVSPVRGWDDETFNELLHINITSKSYQNEKLSKQEVIDSISENLLKQEVEEDEIPCGSRDDGVSKDSIKDITTTATDDETVDQIHRKVFNTMCMNGLMSDYVSDLKKKGYTDRFVMELMLETGESGSKPSLRLMKAIGDRWIADGIYTRIEAKRRKGLQLVQGGQAQRKSSRQESQTEKLMREIKEGEAHDRTRDQEAVFDHQQHVSEFPYR